MKKLSPSEYAELIQEVLKCENQKFTSTQNITTFESGNPVVLFLLTIKLVHTINLRNVFYYPVIF